MQSLPIMVSSAVPGLSLVGCDFRLFPALTSSRAVAQGVALRHSLQDDDGAFFIVDFGQVICQWRQWKKLLPRVQVFYAVKCNNDPHLLKLLASLGACFDCASKNEIDQVLSLDGVSADQIVYANPCKTRNYIRHAKSCGVNLMTFDNIDELTKIKQLFPNAELLLRIRLTSDVSAQCPLNVKFGIDPEIGAPELLLEAAKMSLNVVGIAFHVGSGCRDASAYGTAITHAKNLFETGRALGHPMSVLDIGGGYPGFPTQIITFDQIAEVVNKSLEEHFPVDYGVRIIAEPGRYFASAAYTLCCSVMAKTKVPASRITQHGDDDGTDGYMYYINDGVYGSFNCILYDHFQPEGQSLFDKQTDSTWASVWGPTCDGLDRVLEKCRLPRLSEGDWMVFENMGAYTCAAGSEFNGFPRPLFYYHVTENEWQTLEPMLSDIDRMRACSVESTTSELDFSSTAASSSGSSLSSSCSSFSSSLNEHEN